MSSYDQFLSRYYQILKTRGFDRLCDCPQCFKTMVQYEKDQSKYHCLFCDESFERDLKGKWLKIEPRRFLGIFKWYDRKPAQAKVSPIVQRMAKILSEEFRNDQSPAPVIYATSRMKDGMGLPRRFRLASMCYFIAENLKVMIINANLPDDSRVAVLAHELGHDMQFRYELSSSVYKFNKASDKYKEVAAWKYAIFVLKEIGFTQWRAFEVELRNGLEEHGLSHRIQEIKNFKEWVVNHYQRPECAYEARFEQDAHILKAYDQLQSQGVDVQLVTNERICVSKDGVKGFVPLVKNGKISSTDLENILENIQWIREPSIRISNEKGKEHDIKISGAKEAKAYLGKEAKPFKELDWKGKVQKNHSASRENKRVLKDRQRNMEQDMELSL